MVRGSQIWIHFQSSGKGCVRQGSEDNTFNGDFGQECIIFVCVYTYISFYIVENNFISCSVPPPFIYSESKKTKGCGQQAYFLFTFFILISPFLFFLIGQRKYTRIKACILDFACEGPPLEAALYLNCVAHGQGK